MFFKPFAVCYNTFPKCELCLSLGKHEIHWSANMKLHYEIEHPSMEFPQKFEMTQEEKELLEKL